MRKRSITASWKMNLRVEDSMSYRKLYPLYLKLVKKNLKNVRENVESLLAQVKGVYVVKNSERDFESIWNILLFEN